MEFQNGLLIVSLLFLQVTKLVKKNLILDYLVN